MGNSILTITEITRESLRILHNNLVFARGVNRQYSSEFGVSGAKIGTTLNIRKPNQYFVRTGDAINVQNTTETYVPLTLNKKYGVDVNFSDSELLLSMDDFGKRILSPAMAKIASAIDADGLALATQIYNFVGTPGQTAGANTGSGMATVNTPQIFLNAGVALDNSATPRDESRRIVLNPIAMGGSIAGLSGLFQDAGLVGEQYRKGVMGTALGFEFAMDQNVNLLTTGNRATTALTVTANQSGSTLVINGVGANATISNGEKFTIAGVYAINPENQFNTGLLQQFTVLAAANADASGTATITIAPAIIVAGAQIANGTVTALPTAGATLTWQGSASTAYPMNLAYHMDAFTLATADLPLHGGVDFAARETYDGISMRIIRDYNITNDTNPCRIDVLAGWGVLRPECATVIWG